MFKTRDVWFRETFGASENQRRAQVNLTRFKRRRYTESPTPLERLSRLSAILGGPTIYVKRDDLLGLPCGGNKTRKLEFVVADALSQGADTRITCGAVQSNHCRLTLAAAVKEGMKCRLVLEERVRNYDHPYSGNYFLFQLLGAEKITVAPGGSDMTGKLEEAADEALAEGRKPYVIPGGAATPLGALGYVCCAQELLDQAAESQIRIDHVVCASGSGGTQAGLVTGFWAARSDAAVTGISVRRKKDEQVQVVHNLALQTAALADIGDNIPRESIVCFDEYIGPGYSVPTVGMVEAVKLLSRTEALLLDPVYTGKAMAGLIDLVRTGHFRESENVVFVHTGGTPALFAYMDTILGEQSR